MRTVVFLFLPIFICLSCSNPSDTNHTEKPLTTEYDPEKAGAVVVESFNISNSVFFPYQYDLGDRITLSYDLAEYDGDIYIRIQDRLYIFDKQTMVKKREVRLDFPMGHSFRCYEFQGLLVTADFTLLQFRVNSTESPGLYYSHIFSIDVATGDVTALDGEKTFGEQLKFKGTPCMGYDKANDLLWFWVRDQKTSETSKTSIFYFFRYDKETETFTACGTKDGFLFVKDSFGYAPWDTIVGISMHDFETWTLHYSFNGTYSYIGGIDRRKLDNPAELLHRIDAKYLGVDMQFYYAWAGEKGIIYDDPYIWMMVEKDYKIQMLKLLPN